MASHDVSSLAHLPDEMFSIIKAATHNVAPRLARLSLANRQPVETPHYLAITSRGIVPHITQDTFVRDTAINGVYVPIEDFIERAPHSIPPIYQFKPPDGSSPLRRFVALPDNSLLVLGPRRTPPVIPPPATSNTNSTVSICTAVGFRPLEAEDYAKASEQLQPDIIIGLSDIPYGRALGWKRVEKATDRQIQWMQNHVALRKKSKDLAKNAELFAPLLPVSCAKQDFYIECLTDRIAQDISGLAFYDVETMEGMPASLGALPRLAFTEPSTPHQVLRHISLGMDIVTIPFISAATDAGIALDFTFPTPSMEVNGHDHTAPRPVGIDMWLSSHATDLSAVVQGCTCYPCTNHHRAYIKHLLAAKEMLGWVLLQIHNHHVIDLFFGAIRQSIASDRFDEDVRSFERVYENQLPEKTGQGPRVRGYQFKPEGPGEPKKNPVTFMVMNDKQEKIAEADTPGEDGVDGKQLAEQGFAEKEL